MRQRVTWNKNRQAAADKNADIYSMNGDHPQPSATEYENGDPNSWAETPTKNEYVNQTYDGDHEARNDLGFAEFAPSTFDHKDSKEWGGSGKYDNQRGGMTASAHKAAFAERIARSILRNASEDLIEQQSVDLMNLPPQVLVATAKRMDAVSPNALPKEAKLRRSYACCKLAASMLPSKERFASEETWSNFISSLGKTLMSLDDATLKSILKTSVDAGKQVIATDEDEKDEKVSASKKEDGKKDEKTSASKKEDEKDEKVSASKKEDEKDEDKTASASKEDEKDEKTSAEDKEACDDEMVAAEPGMEDDVGCMSTEDMEMLNNMIDCPAPGLAPAPAAPAPLTDLFAPAPAAPVPGLPMMASDQFDISFGDDEGERVASGGEDLDSLFSDHSEVQAQREIQAARNDQAQRERGFQPARTASQGAKKLGVVQKTASEVQDDLSVLWT